MATPLAPADVELLKEMLLGHLPAADVERLATEFADDHRIAELAESLASRDDTLVDSLRQHETLCDPQADQLIGRIVTWIRTAKDSFGETLGMSGDAAASEQPIPEKLEYFKIVKVLGQGGMGTVYLADDTRLGRPVALKTLKRELAANPAAKDRFLREARSAARLHNDHIIPIHYVGEADGIPFLAMPFLEGEPLDRRLHREPLSIPESVRVAREVALGLSIAHKQGLVHRDIKPANIWLEAPTGRVKILDFGLARSQNEAAQLTASGAIMGTPAYMAPEQARGKQVDARADLFSLGCVLYEMTTGQRPFRGEETMAILSSLALDNPAPPHTLNPKCPPALSELTMQLLAKDPARRPANADAVAQRLATLAVPLVEVMDRTEITPANEPWSHLDESDTAEVPMAVKAEPEALARVKARKRPVLPFVAAALLLALAGIGLAFGGTIFRIVTDQGELLVEVEDKDVEVKIVQDGVVVQDKTTKREFTLKSGKGEIEVYEKDGIKLSTKKFELTRNGKSTVRVTFQELADARAAKGGISPAADRKAAEYVLSIGGNIRIIDNGKEANPKTANELPKGPFQLRIVDLAQNVKATDDGLAVLKDCKELTHLFAQSTGLGDATIRHIRNCTNLTLVNLQKTKVSVQGIDELKTALPNCKIEWDGGVVEPKMSPDRKAAEWVLRQGGTVEVGGNQPKIVNAIENLPKEPFTIAVITLYEAKVDDSALENLEGLTRLGYLQLTKTQITNKGIKRLAGIKGLAALGRLGLTGTDISDECCADLKQFGKLWEIGIVDTRITDTGLKTLAEMASIKSLTIGSPSITDAGIQHLAKLPTLERLDWGTPNVNDLSVDSIVRLVSLNRLTLTYAQITDAGLQKLGQLVNLKYLAVTRTKVTTDGVNKLAAKLPECRIEWDGGVVEPKLSPDADRRAAEWVLSIGGKIWIMENGKQRTIAVPADVPRSPFELTVVSLAQNSKVSDEGLAHFKDCKNLLLLGLSHTQVSNAGLAHFKDCKKLTQISLSATPVSDAGMIHFADCKDLELLDLGATQVGDAGLIHFKDCKNLGSLGLHGTPVTNAGLVHFKDCKNLKGLQLHGTRVTDAGLVHFKDCKNLTHLFLGETEVSDAGLAHFKSCEELTFLNLYASKISDAGLADIKEHKKLTTLDVRKTKVTTKGIDELKAALPNCRIEWDGGVIEPKASPDTNRRVAEWVLSLKGPRYLNFLEPQTGTLNAVNELPNVPLKCFGVINISDDLVDDKVVENLRGVTDTLRLYLNSATLTDAGVDRLIDIAASWKSLGLLELSSTKLTDAGLANIPRLRQVEDLNISANISDAGLRHLEKMSLRGISLHSTSITDEGMKLLARHKLRRLELIWCNKISDMGFANLTELNDLEQLSLISLFGDGALKHLEALKKLKYLKVGSPNVTDTGLQQLSVLTTLTDLNVKGTKATADGVKKLATALPKCKIEWDGGVVEPKK